MSQDEHNVDDSFRTHPLAMAMRDKKEPAPMATCTRDGEPLVSTLEFRNAEFICVVCGTKYGFLAPNPVVATPELDARHAELKAQYQRERAERRTQHSEDHE